MNKQNNWKERLEAILNEKCPGYDYVELIEVMPYIEELIIQAQRETLQEVEEKIQEYADSQTDADIQLAIIGALSLIKELD